jgi:hypothetical protein
MARNSRQNFTVENPQSESGAKLKDKSTRFARELRTKQGISVNNVDGKEEINHVKVSFTDHAFLSSMKESIALTGISIFIISDRLNDYRSVAWLNDLLYIFPVVIFKSKILCMCRDHNFGSSS